MNPAFSSRPIVSLITAVMLILNLGVVILLMQLSSLSFNQAVGTSGIISEKEQFYFGQDILWNIAMPFIGISSLVFTAWIFLALILPLRRMSRALALDEARRLAPLVKMRSEIGGIARQLEWSIRSKLQLTREVAIRKELEIQLRASESRMHDLIMERERFIHDLHDGLIQSIYATGLQLESMAVSRVAGKKSDLLDKMAKELQDVISNLRSSLKQSRSFLSEVHSLGGELRALVERFKAAGLPSLELDYDEKLDAWINPSQAMHIHAICTEALVNCMRHARATKVKMTLRLNKQGLEMSIQDDGIGLTGNWQHGMGLQSMKKRAEELGGVLGISGSVKRGTCIRLNLPGEGY